MVTGPRISALDKLPALGGDKDDAVASAVSLANRNSVAELIEVGGSVPPDKSVPALIAFVEKRGVELSLARGRLLSKCRHPIPADLRELIDQAKELIVAHLQGKPVMCSLCPAAAVTIAAIDAPLCQDCAQ